MFIYFWERERQSTIGGGAEREKETQDPKQAPGPELSAHSPMKGSNPQNAESWPEPKSGQMLNRLNHPGTPQLVLF